MNVALRAPSLAKFGEVDTVPVSKKPSALSTFRPLGYPIKPWPLYNVWSVRTDLYMKLHTELGRLWLDNHNQIHRQACRHSNRCSYPRRCNNILTIFQASLLQGDEIEGLHAKNAHRINCTAKAIAVKVRYKKTTLLELTLPVEVYIGMVQLL